VRVQAAARATLVARKVGKTGTYDLIGKGAPLQGKNIITAASDGARDPGKKKKKKPSSPGFESIKLRRRSDANEAKGNRREIDFPHQ